VDFAKKYELPVVIDVKEKMVDMLFAGEKAAVILFVDDKQEMLG